MLIAVIYVIVEIAIKSPRNLISIAGMAVFILVFYIFSHNPAKVSMLSYILFTSNFFLYDLKCTSADAISIFRPSLLHALFFVGEAKKFILILYYVQLKCSPTDLQGIVVTFGR